MGVAQNELGQEFRQTALLCRTGVTRPAWRLHASVAVGNEWLLAPRVRWSPTLLVGRRGCKVWRMTNRWKYVKDQRAYKVGGDIVMFSIYTEDGIMV